MSFVGQKFVGVKLFYLLCVRKSDTNTQNVLMNLAVILLQETSPSGGAMGQFMMLGAIIVVFYFFMIRPQQRRQKKIAQFRQELQKGDKIITTGGIYGEITELKEGIVKVEISKGVVLKVDRNAILQAPAGTATPTTK